MPFRTCRHPPVSGTRTLTAVIERLERLLDLVIALRETRRPMTAADVRERVAGYGGSDREAFRRMFERDKADLRALGVPIATVGSVDDDRAAYRIPPRDYDLPAVRLDAGELAALALALQATGLAAEAGAGLRKLEVDAGGPPERGRAAGGGGGRVASGGGGVSFGLDLASPHREELLEAQRTRSTVRFAYRPVQRDRQTRTVDPHGLVHRRGWWYLVGHDHDREARRAFRLDRIEGQVTTVAGPGAFATPEGGVDVDAVVPPVAAEGPQQAEVRASPTVAWEVARRARGAGRPEGEDETAWTAFTVAVGDTDAFLAWALEHGPEVEVVGPPDLRAEVVARLESAAGVAP